MAKVTIPIDRFKAYLEENWYKIENEKFDIYAYGEKIENQVMFNEDEGVVLLSIDKSTRNFQLRDWMDPKGRIRTEIAAAVIFYFEYLESANVSIRMHENKLKFSGSLNMIFNHVERLRKRKLDSKAYDHDLSKAIDKYEQIFNEIAN